ncbi:MAG TPA: UDP-N-acetylglucosamine 2-epimerase (non-hydrolyzing) [Usitatibacter sp.]|nr:UDP-N-acetylglucosamine 2-epimerase (non-hydrolyzing) [Usitatibacter sp.]
MTAKPLVHLVAGARPNFMKIAPIVRALRRDGRLDYRLVHTGQHHDREMNDVFFEELGIPQPDERLGCGGGSHAEQTGKIMVAYEALCARQRPDATVVVGDVNSTLAAAIVARKMGVRVAHVEAGLRSGDMAMPEEINRRVTDSISDWFFVTEPSGAGHLLREGKPGASVHEVGNVMVDNLLHQVERLAAMDTAALESDAIKRRLGRFGVVTLHRPANVDDAEALRGLAGALRQVSADLPLVFPVHPRTRANLERFGIDLGPRVHLMGPQPYMSFLHLWKDAVVVLTDSGGLQEETTALGVACVTLRDNTERPITLEQGTNVLAGTRPDRIVAVAREVIATGGRRGNRIPLWDGKAAERIVNVLAKELEVALSSPIPHPPSRVSLFGCNVDNLSMEETLEKVESFIADGRAHQHVVVNVDKLVKARDDPGLRRIINDCALVNADGMPVVWAARMLGVPLKERVAGVDLFEALLARAAERGWRVYLLGAREEVVTRVRELAQQRFPGLQVAGHRDGYWKDAEEPAVAEQVRASRPDILFVAISSPRKERFLGQWQGHMAVPFAMGVGGSFDVFAGLTRRAPVWMQKSGLEWFFRFLQEPRRMFRRYFVDDMAFFGMLARELWLRRRRAVKRAAGVALSVAAAAAAVGSIES